MSVAAIIVNKLVMTVDYYCAPPQKASWGRDGGTESREELIEIERIHIGGRYEMFPEWLSEAFLGKIENAVRRSMREEP